MLLYLYGDIQIQGILCKESSHHHFYNLKGPGTNSPDTEGMIHTII